MQLVSGCNFGDRRCGLFLNISRVPCQVLEAIGMPGMLGLRGKEREQRPTNHRTCFDNHPTLNPVCLHHMTFQSVHLDKIKVTLVTTEAERHASTGSLHWAVRCSLQWTLCWISPDVGLYVNYRVEDTEAHICIRSSRVRYYCGNVCLM